jgi:translation initiation factor IF-1
MVNETDDIILDWYVKSVLGWWTYKVELEWMWMEVSAKAAGKMKLYRIKIIPW